MTVKVDSTIHLDAFGILARAVEEGVAYGLSRSYKRFEKPTQEVIAEEIERAVVASLCEVLAFEGEIEVEDKFNN